MTTLQNKKVFQSIDKVLTYLVGAYMALLAILLPLDLYQFYKQPDLYTDTHHLNTSKKFWELQYALPTMAHLLGALILLTIILLSRNNQHNKTLMVVRQILVFSVTGILIYNFYLWFLTGFDH